MTYSLTSCKPLTTFNLRPASAVNPLHRLLPFVIRWQIHTAKFVPRSVLVFISDDLFNIGPQSHLSTFLSQQGIARPEGLHPPLQPGGVQFHREFLLDQSLVRYSCLLVDSLGQKQTHRVHLRHGCGLLPAAAHRSRSSTRMRLQFAAQTEGFFSLAVQDSTGTPTTLSSCTLATAVGTHKRRKVINKLPETS